MERKWLSDIRNKYGLSQQAVADMAGISQSYYASIETGARGRPLGVPIAKEIAHAFMRTVLNKTRIAPMMSNKQDT